MWLLVGLGNPGPKYARNRHNIGFVALDGVARRHRSEAFRAKFGAEVATGEVKGQRAVLLKPMEYMNLAGFAVQRAAAFHQVEPKAMVAGHEGGAPGSGGLSIKVGGG